MTFLEVLAEKGVVQQKQIGELVTLANKNHGGNIDAALIAFGIPEQTLLQVKSEHFNIPAKTVDSKNVTFEILRRIPEDSAKHYKFIPIGMEEGVLQVGIINPNDKRALDALQFISAKTGIPYKVFLISQKDFDAVLQNYQGLTGEVEQAISQFDTEIEGAEGAGVEEVAAETERIRKGELKPEDEAKIVEEAPIIKVVAVIINHAVEGNASDIHIEHTGEKVKVRFRVDGILHTSLVLPLNVFAGIVARIKILAKLRLDEKRKPQDGGFTAKVGGRRIDFRVSTFPSYYGEKVVMRILDKEKGLKSLDDLNMSSRNISAVREALKKPYGLILITGPTGSGKSTTLYAMLNELDREGSNVVSLEDPVEYHIEGVTQSQVMPEIGYTFANGLRSMLRQDPDVIMVGEIRDAETARLAIQAALTGHLVLSTLHTNNALGVVPRLVDMGIDPYLIAPTLILAMAQRLARKTCESSRKEVPMDPSMKAILEEQFADLPDEIKKEVAVGDKMFETVPSADCPTGTSGRQAVFEMYSVGKDVEQVILTNPTEQAIYEVVRKKGMVTMREDAMLKGIKGEIPFQEVYKFG